MAQSPREIHWSAILADFRRGEHEGLNLISADVVKPASRIRG